MYGSAASVGAARTRGATVRLTMRTTTSPISRRGTSVETAGGSLADEYCCTEDLAAWVEHGYSITRSARNNRECGTVMPRALAVFRLMANSNLSGRSIGSSPGLAPCKILPT